MTASNAAPTVDPSEIARFSAMSETWWDPNGPMRPLHRLNPTRLTWIRDQICEHFQRQPTRAPALGDLRILDIGCGAGLVSEPLTRMGADVIGVDPSESNIHAARIHAAQGGLTIDYRPTTAEDLAGRGEVFDVVLALEVVEHVVDVPLFVSTCSAMVRPGGFFVASTINRTLKAFMLAIVGAEYVLRWLPRGTHSYDRLVQPSELSSAMRNAGLKNQSETGVMYQPVSDGWRLSNDLDVNYMMSARKPG